MEQLLDTNTLPETGALNVKLVVHSQVKNNYVQRFRDGLVFKAHRLCVSLNSKLEGNEEEEAARCRGLRFRGTLNPTPYTLHPVHHTMNPKPHALDTDH